MPTYVYRCDSCGAQFEQFQSFKDEPLRTCPSCASSVRRVFQPVGIVFKGSGWYITDSRKSDSAAVASETKTEETKPSETSTPSSDTKPAETKSSSASTTTTE